MEAAQQHGTDRLLRPQLPRRRSGSRSAARRRRSEVNRELAPLRRRDARQRGGLHRRARLRGRGRRRAPLPRSTRRTSSKMIEQARRRRSPTSRWWRPRCATRRPRRVNDWGAMLLRTTASSTRRRRREGLEIFDRVGGGDSFASGLDLRVPGGQGPAVGRRVRRRARRAGDDDARRHDDGDPGRGGARDEGGGARRVARGAKMTMTRQDVLAQDRRGGPRCPSCARSPPTRRCRSIDAIREGGVPRARDHDDRAGRRRRDRAGGPALRRPTSCWGAGTVPRRRDRARLHPRRRPLRREPRAEPRHDRAAAGATRSPCMPGALTPTEVRGGLERGRGRGEGLPVRGARRRQLHQVAQGPAAPGRDRSRPAASR